MKLRSYITVLFLAFVALTSLSVHAQEGDPFLPYRVAQQNLLKFNRFLINPTFSTVREDKSYINLLHRNQSVQFQDNDQTYFLSYSGRIGDRSGLGLSLYSQRVGPVSNIGVLANYAYGVKLSNKSNFTFGGNFAYYSTGLNRTNIDAIDLNDPRLNGTEDSNVISFQPGFNISYGRFDFGAFAENLFEYNLKTSESLTEFAEKTYSAHLQYTYPFSNDTGIFESARLMPLARVTLSGQNNLTGEIEQNVVLGGSLILDLPKVGWLQGGYDNLYGASAGAGFNINRRLSLGYTVEKGFGTDLNNLGVTHEISFAYSFTPNLTEDRVLFEDGEDELVRNAAFAEDDLASNDEIEELKDKLAENDAIVAELMFRQDSIESHRQKDLERRFEMVMRMVRSETNNERPDLEKRAEKIFLEGRDKPIAIANNNVKKIPNGVKFTVEEGETEKPVIRTTATRTIITPEVEEEVAENEPDIQTNTTRTIITPTEIEEEIVENESDPQSTATRSIIIPTEEVEEEIVENNTTLEKTSKRTIKEPTRAVAVVAQDKTKNTLQSKNRNGIKSKKYKNLDGVKDGYYIVANVYKGGKYMNDFIGDMNEKGFNSNYIENPSNGLKYVYLERYDTWQEATEAYKSNMNGNYENDLWVMNVDNRYTNEAYANNVNKLNKKSSKYGTTVLQQNVIEKDKIASNKIAPKTYKIDGIGSGYYIIANVFSKPNNAKRFIKLLNSYGLSASYFINPENNWRYVYLKKHESWNNALISYYSKINDSYNDKMWIMRVKKYQQLV